MLSGEIFSPTRLLFQYMKALTKSEKLRAFIAPKMTDLITFPDKNGKSTVYEGGDINGIYLYLDIIGAPTTLNTSGHRYHHFGPRMIHASALCPILPQHSQILFCLMRRAAITGWRVVA